MDYRREFLTLPDIRNFKPKPTYIHQTTGKMSLLDQLSERYFHTSATANTTPLFLPPSVIDLTPPASRRKMLKVSYPCTGPPSATTTHSSPITATIRTLLIDKEATSCLATWLTKNRSWRRMSTSKDLALRRKAQVAMHRANWMSFPSPITPVTVLHPLVEGYETDALF